ncbi:MAG TPA: CdaR family protein [Mobilitalea sp.]|nr:CdaR family protein [Mobilitalea sp.]
MKKKLTKNIGLKTLSIFFAAILWLLITNADNPIVSRSFSNIPVTILNESVIDNPNQIYEIVDGERIDFKVAARRSIIENLTDADFRVEADFAKLLGSNTVIIDIICTKYPSEVEIKQRHSETLTIKLEELSDEDFKVNVELQGDVPEGYTIVEKKASPNIIRVSGPKGRIDKIASVSAVVDVTGTSRSLNKIAEPKALDEEGKEIDASKLTFSSRYIEVDLKLYKTKTVDLSIKPEGELADGYVYVEEDIDYEPKTITIAAEDRILENTNSLTAVVNIAGESADIERDIDLKEENMLPEGVIIVGDNHTVGVNIKIEKLETKEITIWPKDIELKGIKDDVKAYFSNTGPIDIMLKGTIEELEGLNRNTLNPYIDLTDSSVGTYALLLKAKLSGNTLISDPPIVNIWLMLK